MKIIWRYGYNAPRKAQALYVLHSQYPFTLFIHSRCLVLLMHLPHSTKEMIDRFSKVYTPQFPRFSSILSLASYVDLDTVAAQTAAEYFDEQGVGRKWSREVIEAATRVNYGQVCSKGNLILCKFMFYGPTDAWARIRTLTIYML